MSDDNTSLKLIKSKLNRLVQYIVDKAESDSEFRQQLEQILLDSTQPKSNASNRKKLSLSTFNPVAYLQQHGEVMLRQTLEEKTDSELQAIIRSEGIRKGKALKNIERQQMIDELVANSDRRLKQGSSFLQS